MHRFVIACIFAAVISAHAADASPSGEEAAWEAVNIDRTFKGYPEKATPEELAALKQKRADEYEQVAKEFEDFRLKYPGSKHAWTSTMAQIDYLQDALMLGRTNWAGKLDLLTMQFIARADTPREWANLHELKQSDRQAWLAAHGDEAAYHADSLQRWIKLLAGKTGEEDQAFMAKHILQEIEGIHDASRRKDLAERVSASTTNHEVQHKVERMVARTDGLEKPFDLKFTAVDGRKVDVAALRGKVVMIMFWATWCGPCRAELPHLKEEYKEHHGEGLEIIGVSLDTDKPTLEKFLKKESMPWPQFFDGKMWDNQLAEKFGIEATPTTFLVDKKGILVDTGVQGVSFEELLLAK